MSKLEYAVKRLKEYKASIGAVNEYDVIRSVVDVCKEEIQCPYPEACVKPEPELIQGYTAEQWQEIIDGGYLCEFSDSDGEWKLAKMELTVFEPNMPHPFLSLKGNNYINCRPAQIKGVMRPIFVEPVDKDASCVFFGQHGTPLHSNVRWGYELGVSNSKAAKYIEV